MTASTPNPYAPGAGYPPPELAGRDSIIADAREAIVSSRAGTPARSFLLVGLRGVGKTVLLNAIQDIAEAEGAVTDFVEVSTATPLSREIVTILRTALLKLDRLQGASAKVKKALRVLKSFVGSVKVRYEDIEFTLDIEPETGIADSGTLTRDLSDLFIAAGEAARARDKSIVILIDEIQSLSVEEFEALIVAIHRVDQKKLPLLVVGAGLPLLVKLAGDAKSYAERLFDYPEIGPLSEKESRRALAKPAAEAGVRYDEEAIALVVQQTQGYPYFLQEWGYQCWKARKGPTISLQDARRAGKAAVERLDRNFFRSRFERLSDPQKNYLRAMAALGPGPHRTGDIARQMGKTTQQLGPHREALINNGMIYSPRYGMAAFTVPLFDDFMRRAMA